MTGTTRGRPTISEKHTVDIGGEKIVISAIEGEDRIQISIPGAWNMAAMSSGTKRKRIDLIATGESSTAAKAAPKTRTRAKAKKVTAPVPTVDLTDAAPKPTRRRRRTKAQMAEARAAEEAASGS